MTFRLIQQVYDVKLGEYLPSDCREIDEEEALQLIDDYSQVRSDGASLAFLLHWKKET